MRVIGAVRGRHLFVADLLVVGLSIVASMALRYDSLHLDQNAFLYLPAALFPLFVRPPINVAFGLYSRVWAYASIGELARIAAAVAVGSVVGIIVFYGLLVPAGVPGTV